MGSIRRGYAARNFAISFAANMKTTAASFARSISRPNEAPATIRHLAGSSYLSLCVHRLRRHRGWRRRRRYSKCDPGVPAVGSVVGVEFPIGLQVEISLYVADRKQISELRTNSDNARSVFTQKSRSTAVPGELFVEISDGTDLPLLGEELRSA